MITIFESTITDTVLAELQAESEKYTDLYVDMDNAPERKFVKDKASTINGLLKNLDRARIDKSRDYKIMVEAEAERIKDSLNNANRPFTLLIGEYTAKRKEILAREKAGRDARELIIQIGKDYDEAELMNKMFEFELAEKKCQQARRDEAIRKSAAEQATRLAEQDARRTVEIAENKARDAIAKVERDNQARLDAERIKQEEQAARDADKEHKRAINRQSVEELRGACGMSEDEAKNIVMAICNGAISAIRITY